MTATSEIWSSTDYPYLCLKDQRRTLAFRDAIYRAVRPGDVVVDAGAGSGIMSLFAAKAGARKVYAVELEPQLAAALRETARRNGLGDVITVVESDLVDVSSAGRLPSADVVIAELIDTGLLDEMQVPVINGLWRAGVVTPRTRLVPQRYTTRLELVHASHHYYGFEIYAPKHEWPYYHGPDWHPTEIEALATPVVVSDVDFRSGPVGPVVEGSTTVAIDRAATVTAVRMSGHIELADGLALDACNSVNGDKVIAVGPITGTSHVKLSYRYEMGAGLASLHLHLGCATSASPRIRR